jgi:hypothetical protein
VSTKLLVSVASISIVLAGLTGTVAVKSSFAATIYQVPPSIAADCSIDVTQPILSWIASVPDNSVVSFGTGACYRIEATLEMTGRNGLTFEGNGSTFRSFNPPQDQRAIWRVIGSTNFVFRNMTVYERRGSRCDPSTCTRLRLPWHQRRGGQHQGTEHVW